MFLIIVSIMSIRVWLVRFLAFYYLAPPLLCLWIRHWLEEPQNVSLPVFISRGERKTDLVYSAATQLLLQEESEPREAMPNRPLVIYTLLNFYVIRLTYQLYKYMVQTHNKRKQAPRAHNTIIHAKVPNNYPKLHHTKTNGLCVSMVQFY